MTRKFMQIKEGYMSRLGVLGLLFVGLSVPPAVADHWIAVGSFKNRDAAEKGLLQATAKTSESLSVVASESSAGIYYRVSAGPYATLVDAKRALPDVLDAGLSGAWIWQLKSFASVANAERSEPIRARLSSALADIDGLDFPELDETVLPRRSRAVSSMRTNSSPTEVQDAPQEAPPGYQLHRLRRNN